MLKCLIIEDDVMVIRLLKNILNEKYLLSFANNALNAIDMLDENFDIIILDLGLPDLDGMDLIKIIRSKLDSIIIVLTARDLDNSKIKALNLGADDYITKPFNIDELLARIHAITRRIKKDSIKVFTNKNLMINYETRCVYIDNNLIHLTPLEYSLIEILSKNIGKAIGYLQILKEIWNLKSLDDYSLANLRVIMATLRRKLKIGGNEYILTILGYGYRMPYIE